MECNSVSVSDLLCVCVPQLLLARSDLRREIVFKVAIR